MRSTGYHIDRRTWVNHRRGTQGYGLCVRQFQSFEKRLAVVDGLHVNRRGGVRPTQGTIEHFLGCGQPQLCIVTIQRFFQSQHRFLGELVQHSLDVFGVFGRPTGFPECPGANLPFILGEMLRGDFMCNVITLFAI